jgi:hypothetical protein
MAAGACKAAAYNLRRHPRIVRRSNLAGRPLHLPRSTPVRPHHSKARRRPDASRMVSRTPSAQHQAPHRGGRRGRSRRLRLSYPPRNPWSQSHPTAPAHRLHLATPRRPLRSRLRCGCQPPLLRCRIRLAPAPLPKRDPFGVASAGHPSASFLSLCRYRIHDGCRSGRRRTMTPSPRKCPPSASFDVARTWARCTCIHLRAGRLPAPAGLVSVLPGATHTGLGRAVFRVGAALPL